ncbi:MAG TPA: choice-of-anchor tandem repeat GloVer-containing protein [Terriglobales bacterium]|nr:choice-of-anchor tandem repeat GloVer-containing protein [Terriglobales bacterium]
MTSQLCAIFRKASLIAATSFTLLGICHAAGYKRTYNFGAGFDGVNPASRLVFDSAGNAYGTTAAGGDSDLGTIFMVTPAGEEQVLYSFEGGGDGSDPHGGVILDSAGNLYGTAVAGGYGGICAGDGCGGVFELTNSGGSWALLTLYSFTGGDDGFGPGSPLIWDAAGDLYGTAPDGGKHGSGVVFELSPTPNGWVQRVLHAFTGKKDGAVGSLGALLIDSAGNLYGTSELGGDVGAGAVYQLSPTGSGSWKFTPLYDFKGMPDAANPYGGLTLDDAGNLYGTTYFGGQYGVGTVFQLAHGPNGAWQENILYNFQGGTDGSFPTSTLLFTNPTTLMGTTTTGGRPSCDCGTVFSLKFAHGQWKEKLGHLFGKGRDGSYPNYGLTFDPAGSLWGSTPVGGTNGGGTLFRLTP